MMTPLGYSGLAQFTNSSYNMLANC